VRKWALALAENSFRPFPAEAGRLLKNGGSKMDFREFSKYIIGFGGLILAWGIIQYAINQPVQRNVSVNMNDANSWLRAAGSTLSDFEDNINSC
jgi:hypothetical protein